MRRPRCLLNRARPAAAPSPPRVGGDRSRTRVERTALAPRVARRRMAVAPDDGCGRAREPGLVRHPPSSSPATRLVHAGEAGSLTGGHARLRPALREGALLLLAIAAYA